MGFYKIITLPSVEKQMRKIDSKKLREAIDEKIWQLAVDPHSAPGRKKIIGGNVPNTYRVRQNNYRIVFTIDNKRRVVTIVEVANRDAAYKKLAH